MSEENKDKKKPNIYFLPPPVIPSYYEYQDINNDVELRTTVVNFFFKKLKKWVKNEKIFIKYQDYDIDNKKTKRKLYKLLRFYVKKGNINWYDLRNNYFLIKQYLYKHFKSLL